MCTKDTHVRICRAALLITAKSRKFTQMPVTSRMNKSNVEIQRLKYYTVMTLHFNHAQEYGCNNKCNVEQKKPDTKQILYDSIT